MCVLLKECAPIIPQLFQFWFYLNFNGKKILNIQLYLHCNLNITKPPQMHPSPPRAFQWYILSKSGCLFVPSPSPPPQSCCSWPLLVLGERVEGGALPIIVNFRLMVLMLGIGIQANSGWMASFSSPSLFAKSTNYCTRLYMQKLLIAFMFVKLILSLNSCDLMDEIESIWRTWGMQNLGNN